MVHPAPELCLDLLAELAAPGHLVAHLRQVSAAAGRLAVLCGADAGFCIAAAWLHDVGKARLAPDRLAELLGVDRDCAARLDHGRLGARLLRLLGSPYAELADAVERHLIGSVLFGPPPRTLEEKTVFFADKLVGAEWLGFRGRMDDLAARHGHLFDIRLCEPGTEAVFLELAHEAALGTADLERLVGASVAEAVLGAAAQETEVGHGRCQGSRPGSD